MFALFYDIVWLCTVNGIFWNFGLEFWWKKLELWYERKYAVFSGTRPSPPYQGPGMDEHTYEGSSGGAQAPRVSVGGILQMAGVNSPSCSTLAKARTAGRQHFLKIGFKCPFSDAFLCSLIQYPSHFCFHAYRVFFSTTKWKKINNCIFDFFGVNNNREINFIGGGGPYSLCELAQTEHLLIREVKSFYYISAVTCSSSSISATGSIASVTTYRLESSEEEEGQGGQQEAQGQLSNGALPSPNRLSSGMQSWFFFCLGLHFLWDCPSELPSGMRTDSDWQQDKKHLAKGP